MAEKQCTKCGKVKPQDRFMFRPARGNYYTVCRDCMNARQMERLRANPGRAREYWQRFKNNNPEGYRARSKRSNAKRYSSPSGKLDVLIRNAVYRSLSGRRKQQPTYAALGYSLQDLKSHLERQFQRGMSWGNYGEWHVDHIVPIAAFNIESSDCDDFRAAWALSNLRPLWGTDNVRKQDKRTHLL